MHDYEFLFLIYFIAHLFENLAQRETTVAWEKNLIIFINIYVFETCRLCLLESSMDQHATGLSCLSSGFLYLAYGLHERMVRIPHDMSVHF